LLSLRRSISNGEVFSVNKHHRPVTLIDERVEIGHGGSLANTKLWAAYAVQLLPCCPLRRVPRRALPRGAYRARGRVLHPGRVERGPPASFIVLSQLQVEALPVHPYGDVANPSP